MKATDVFAELLTDAGDIPTKTSVELISVDVDGTCLHTFSRRVIAQPEVAFVVTSGAKKVSSKKPKSR